MSNRADAKIMINHKFRQSLTVNKNNLCRMLLACISLGIFRKFCRSDEQSARSPLTRQRPDKFLNLRPSDTTGRVPALRLNIDLIKAQLILFYDSIYPLIS